MPAPAAALLVAAASLSAPLCAQQILTVAAAGGAMFTDIGAAVAAASNGDVLLVAGGTYAPFTISGKSLTILANGAMVFAPGSSPTPVPPTVTIENLALGQKVQVVGLSAMGFSPAPALLLVRNNQGSVWLHDVFCDAFGSPAVGVEGSVDVVIENGLLQANRAALSPSGVPVPTPGMRCTASSVYVYDTEVRGSTGSLGGGAFPTPTAAADGGDGIRIDGGFLGIEGGRVIGGSGITLYAPACNQGGNGGDAIEMFATTANLPTVRLRNVALQAGTASLNTCPGTVSNGMQLQVLSGTPILDGGVERLLQGPAGLPGPGVAAIEVAGAPGDVAFVVAGFPGPRIYVSGLPLHLYPPFVTLGFAAIGASGRGTLNVPLPGLGPAAPPIVFGLQALVLDTGLGAFATNPRPLVLR